MGWDISQTTTTTRAPLAVLKRELGTLNTTKAPKTGKATTRPESLETRVEPGLGHAATSSSGLLKMSPNHIHI